MLEIYLASCRNHQVLEVNNFLLVELDTPCLNVYLVCSHLRVWEEDIHFLVDSYIPFHDDQLWVWAICSHLKVLEEDTKTWYL